ncbi:hypothetical protein X738_24780 [Mesorhizobium sp. LNHC209A00]|nr:hypothetical protein X738_24780 [Mesorhizobium sp. LNHC209A00]
MDIESGLEEAGFEVITASLPITPSKSLMQPLHSDKARGLDRVRSCPDIDSWFNRRADVFAAISRIPKVKVIIAHVLLAPQ